jgi:hypothetical protein
MAAEVGGVEEEEATLAVRETAQVGGRKTDSGAVPGPGLWITLTLFKSEDRVKKNKGRTV